MRQWVQLSAGRGPVECAWALTRVMRAFVDDAGRHGLAIELLDTTTGPLPDTLSSVLLAVDGNAAAWLREWTGTVLWIARSPFRPNHKRKNWYVSIAAFALPAQPEWSERDLKFETMRAAGPGGQHVNKTESAVRITHLLTGMAVTAREERSQAANRKLALARLAAKFAALRADHAQRAEQERWMQHNTLERGNPVRVFEDGK